MQKFKINIENEQGNVTVLSIEPLEAGYGHTLGNSLKRTMLNSLGGAAITSIKIANVSHQFSTIPGVLEDVIEIILNLKKVRLKLYGEKSGKIKLSVSGKKQVTAADIDTMGVAEVVNPTQHIATLTDDKGKLNIEMTVEVGVGYLVSDDRKSSEIGVIPVDAIFTPILSVNYTVDQTRVGRRTDFDKITMEVTTDGTITAMEAVQKSAQILNGYYTQIVDPSEEEEVEEKPQSSFMSDDVMKSSIEELDLPVRITNALKAIDIDTIGKLTTVNPGHLMKAKNLGAKSLGLISEKLVERGLSLGEA